MRKILTAVLVATVVVSMAILAVPGMAQFDPGKQLGPKSKMAGPPLNPAQQAQADKLAKEKLEIQLRENAERKKAEKARAEELKNAKGIMKVPVDATSKQPSPAKK